MKRDDISEKDPDSCELADLCADYLRCEEGLLAAVLALLRAMQAAFVARGLESLKTALGGHRECAKLIEDVNLRRQHFRDALARRLGLAAQDVTLARVLACLDGPAKTGVADAAARVGRLAEEAVLIHARVRIHVRIHLDAYRRVLRDLTNTAASSGRYGPAGRTESLDYRPLVFVHG
jgi:hypothetical protein